jgi:leucyl aminopeptidase
MFNLKFNSFDKKKSNKNPVKSIFFILERNNSKYDFNIVRDTIGINLSASVIKQFSNVTNELDFSIVENPLHSVKLAKVKKDKLFNVDYFRNYFAGLVKSFYNDSIEVLQIHLPKFDDYKDYFNDEKYFIQTIVEGFYYGNYEFDNYKSDRKKKKDLTVVILGENSSLINSSIKTASTVMEGLQFTRDLQNEPGNVLYPETLAHRIKSHFKGTGVKVTALNEKEIQKRKMGALWSVGKGSVHLPRMIILEYVPIRKKSKNRKTIALVGKGITFDTGGISIKPADRMWEMKGDMSGAAVVAGIIHAAAKSELDIELLGVIPAAENMLSSTAYKPGDIITASNGKTIEIDNTDAEGRVALADALVYASNKNPDLIIDFATLTGACVVALGEFVSGMFSNNDNSAESLYKSGQKTFDRIWRLPIWEDYNTLNHSDFADVKNCGPRWGGAISAAKFLENFVSPNIPWVHLDIAGPSGPYKYNNYTSPYFTGFGVRLIYDFLSNEITL